MKFEASVEMIGLKKVALIDGFELLERRESSGDKVSTLSRCISV